MDPLFCSYNIMSGCFDSYEQNSKLTDRFDKLKEGLRNINANFVGLVDTFKWADTFTNEDLQKHFGYKNNFSINMNDQRVGESIGITVMTNLNIISFGTIHAYNRDFIKTTLNLKPEPINIYTIYLDDLSEDTRLRQIKELLKQIKEPAVIHGDFNSLDSEDIPKMQVKEESFVKENKELAKKFMPIIKDMKRGEVIKTIKEKGFIDAFGEYAPTIPSPAFPGNISGPVFRVDYFFHSESLKTSLPEVKRGNILDQISDHYPISIILNS